MAEAEEEATVAGGAAEDMGAVMTADLTVGTIEARIETADPHPSKKVKRLTLQSTLSAKEETG